MEHIGSLWHMGSAQSLRLGVLSERNQNSVATVQSARTLSGTGPSKGTGREQICHVLYGAL